MINLIAATNRKANLTSVFSQKIYQQLDKERVAFSSFSLEDLPLSTSFNDIYAYGQSPFTEIAKNYIEPADKFLFVIPEYNGSFPGILKVLIDGIEPKYFRGKKAAMVGVASGHAGNIRGVDHFTGVLNYIGVTVMPKNLCIPRIEDKIEEGELVDQACIERLDNFVKQFIDY